MIKANDLISIMINLSQVEDIEEIKSNFIKSMNNLWAELHFSWTDQNNRKNTEIIAVNTSKKEFGYILVQGNMAAIEQEQYELIQNSIAMLAIILENRWQNVLLAQTSNHKENVRFHETRFRLAMEAANDDSWDYNPKTGIHANVTEQMKVLEELCESEERIWSLLETVPLGIYECDIHGQVTLTNSYFSYISGYSVEEILSMMIWDFLEPGSQRDSMPDYFNYLITEQPEPTTFYGRNQNKNGDIVDIQVDWTYKRSNEGKVIGFVCAIANISQCQQAELETEKLIEDLQESIQKEQVSRGELESAYDKAQAAYEEMEASQLAMQEINKKLIQSEEKYRRLVELSHAGIWLINGDSYTTFVNPRMAEMLGYSIDEMVGKHLFDFLEGHTIDVYNQHIKLIKQGIKEHFELELLTKTQQRLYAAVETSPITDKLGNFSGAVIGVIDISDRKRSEEDQLASIHFFESMELVDQIINQALDIEQMLRNVIKTVFSIFNSDRVWLLYPCDPKGSSFTIPFEITKPEFPGALALGKAIPITQYTANGLQVALNTDGPIVFVTSLVKPVSKDTAELFSVQSQIFMAIYPKIGRPWLFGMHHCSYQRIWSENEQKLFKEIGRRIADALSSMLFIKELRESEEKYRSLFTNMIDGYAYCRAIPDSDNQLMDILFLEVNDNYAEVMNQKKEHVIGKKVTEILPGIKEAHPGLFDNYAKVAFLGEGISFHYYNKIINKWLAISAYRPKKGHYVAILQDITDQKLAEEEIRRLRNLLSNIVDSMPSVLIGVDTKGCVTHWNHHAERKTGLSIDQVKNKKLNEIKSFFDQHIDLLNNALDKREPQIKQKIQVLNKGQQQYHDIMVYPLMADDLEGAVIRIDDVTERVRMEEIMVQTEKMMSVGGLAAGMAHEINNPLGGILQAIQNIQRRLSTEFAKNSEIAQELGISLDSIHLYIKEREIFKFIDDIKKAGTRASKIVANMLQFSRQSHSQKELTDIHELLDHTIELAASDYDLKKNFDFRHIIITRDFDFNLPAISIIYTEIEQVILNLLKNAAQAMSERVVKESPTITIRTKQIDQMLQIDIEDIGPGMTDDIRKRIFEPFFTTKEVGEGTGLGLSVSYMIIANNHNGNMLVESSPGKGSKFIILLPLTTENNE